jgi:hypothetical protein
VTTINTTVNNSLGILTAAQANATYQWINCEDSAAIQGENNVTFEPFSNGDYAVEITINGCASTSGCHQFETASLKEEKSSTLFRLYPNPSNGTINIESLKNHELFIYDTKLSLVFSSDFNKGKQVLNHNLKSGIYIWKTIDADSKIRSGKLIVQ